MTRGRLLALNALSMLVANIIAKVILFVGMVFLLQYLSPGLESTYYLITAFGAIVALNFQDGMVSVTIRRIATDLENGATHLGSLYFASMFLAITLGLITIPLSFLYAGSALEGSGLQGEFILSTCFLVLAYLVGYGYSCAGAGFKAYEKLYLEAILVVLQAILNAAVLWYGTVQQWPLSRFFMWLCAANGIHSILAQIILSAFVVSPKFNWSIPEAQGLIRESLRLGYATLLRTIQDRIHPFFIDSFARHELITQVSSSNQLLVQLKFIPLSVRPAIFPTIARKAEMDNDDFQVFSIALMKFLYLVAIPLIILLIIARREILPLVTTVGPNFEIHYAMALAIYPLVGWSVILSFPSQVLRSLFIALKKPKFEFWTVFAGVAVLAFLDIVFIPTVGVIVCGYASIACEVTILIFGLYLLRQAGRALEIMTLFVHSTLCGILVHLIAEYLYGLHWALGLASVLVLFPACVVLFRIISQREWEIIREIVKPGSSASHNNASNSTRQ